MIAADAVDGALGRICQDVFLERGLADFFSDTGFLGERFACGFVFHEFDGLQETEATDLADVGMRFQRRERFAERFAGGRDAIEEFVDLKIIEDRVAGGGGDGMRLIGEAVHEGGGAIFKSIYDAGSDEDCA